MAVPPTCVIHSLEAGMREQDPTFFFSSKHSLDPQWGGSQTPARRAWESEASDKPQ